MSFIDNLGKLQLAAEKVSDNRYLKAVSKGMVMTIPASITGAMCTLIANLPFAGYQSFIEDIVVTTGSIHKQYHGVNRRLLYCLQFGEILRY